MMNILFLDAYYEPETIAYTHLEKDLIEGLVSAGHKVTIICPIPTRGITEEIRTKYKNIRYEEKFYGKVIIERFWAPQEGKNPLVRAFRYFWCNVRTYQKACKKRSIDVVFSNSTPPTQGALSGLVAKKLGRKAGRKVLFVYNLQDIFPDSLVNAKLANEGGMLWKIGRKLEDFTYRHADHIILISQGFKRNIMAKGVPEDKISVISNWIDLSDVHPVDRNENKLISELNLDPNKFIVVYAGNFGATQGADIVLKVARELQSNKDIQFVIFGGGPYFADAIVEAEQLDNVFIRPLMPQERISEVYSLGDVALITCKAGTGKAGMPSKTWSIMACNTPIIASFDIDSDLAESISEAGAGKCVEASNIHLLITAVEDAYKDFSLESRNTNTRNYVMKKAEKKACVESYIKILVESNIS